MLSSIIKITLIVTAGFILFSCEKPITGNINDNFDQPVESVEISIENSDFSTQSNPAGDFSIDYVPGKIEVTFQKEGYLSESRTLEISEKATYPLGTVTLIRLPLAPGLYTKSELAYDSLSQTTPIKETKDINVLGMLIKSNKYLEPREEMNIVQGDSTLVLYSYQLPNLALFKASDQGLIVVENISALENAVQGQEVKYNIRELGGGLRRLAFKPGDNETYCLVETKGRILNRMVGDKFFCFKTESTI